VELGPGFNTNCFLHPLYASASQVVLLVFKEGIAFQTRSHTASPDASVPKRLSAKTPQPWAFQVARAARRQKIRNPITEID